MKVSVVTVCYNAGATIELTIQSVINQDYRDVEYIVIDGGSTDETHSIINKYKDSISHIVIGIDKGMYDAMNKGIALCKGDVVSILNADDVFCRSDVLSRVVSEFTSSNNVDAILTDVSFISGNDLERTTTRVVSAKGFLPWKLRFGWMPPHPGMFLKRKIYDEYGEYRLSYKIAADYEFMVRIFLAGNTKFIVSKFLSVIMREGGVSTRGLISNHIITTEIVKSCIDNNIFTNYLLVSLRLPIKFFKQVVFRKK